MNKKTEKRIILGIVFAICAIVGLELTQWSFKVYLGMIMIMASWHGFYEIITKGDNK